MMSLETQDYVFHNQLNVRVIQDRIIE